MLHGPALGEPTAPSLCPCTDGSPSRAVPRLVLLSALSTQVRGICRRLWNRFIWSCSPSPGGTAPHAELPGGQCPAGLTRLSRHGPPCRLPQSLETKKTPGGPQTHCEGCLPPSQSPAPHSGEALGCRSGVMLGEAAYPESLVRTGDCRDRKTWEGGLPGHTGAALLCPQPRPRRGCPCMGLAWAGTGDPMKSSPPQSCLTP